MQHRARELVGDPQPGDGRAIAESDLLRRVDLPNLVGYGRPPLRDFRPPPRRRRAESGAGEPPLEGSRRGQRADPLSSEIDPDQDGPPAGVFAAQEQGRFVGGVVRRWGRAGAVSVRGGHTALRPPPPRSDQVSHGARCDAEILAQLSDGRPMFEAAPHRLADRQGYWGRHGRILI